MEKYKICGEIRGLNNLIKRKIDSDPVFSQQRTVTGTHGYILGFIMRQSMDGTPVYQRDIEKAFSIRRSSATEILNAMEQNGLLVRKPSSKDKRLKELALTQKAIDAHTLIVSRLDAVDSELCSVLSAEELASLKSILSKLKSHLNEIE